MLEIIAIPKAVGKPKLTRQPFHPEFLRTSSLLRTRL